MSGNLVGELYFLDAAVSVTYSCKILVGPIFQSLNKFLRNADFWQVHESTVLRSFVSSMLSPLQISTFLRIICVRSLISAYLQWSSVGCTLHSETLLIKLSISNDSSRKTHSKLKLYTCRKYVSITVPSRYLPSWKPNKKPSTNLNWQFRFCKNFKLFSNFSVARVLI